MATYGINIGNSGGALTPIVRRAPSVASGGTVLTIPSGELFPGTSTQWVGLAAGAAMRACLNDASVNGIAAYNITLTDDGSGNFTPTARRAGTAASGGTVVAIPSGELFPGTTTELLGLAIGAATRAVLNDRSAGN